MNLVAPAAGGEANPPSRSARGAHNMIFEQIATGGCQSYLIGCPDTHAAVLIDPALSQIDRYLGLASREGLRLRYVIDTHTHADHFSAAREIARAAGVPIAAHRLSPRPTSTCGWTTATCSWWAR